MTDKHDDSISLPCDVPAEQSVLGAALIDPSAAANLSMMIDADDFFLSKHGTIYRAIVSLTQRAIVPDVVTMADELNGSLKDCGGVSYLVDLMNATPTALYAEHYAQVVKRKAALRRAIQFSTEVARMAYEGDISEAELSMRVDDLKARYLSPREVSDKVVTWQDSLAEHLDMIQAESETVENRDGFDWPFNLWNEKLGDFPAGLTMQILGDDGTGKTQLADILADHWSGKRGKWGLYITTDMPRILVEKRRTSRHSGVLANRLNTNMTDAELGGVMGAMEKLRSWQGGIHYVFDPELDIDQTCRLIEAVHGQLEIDYAVLDNLNNFIDFPSPRQMKLNMSETQRVADNASRFIARIGKLGIRGVVINQLTKAGKDARSIDDVSKNDAYSSGRQSNKIRLNVNLWRGYAEAPEYGMNGELLANTGDRSKYLWYKFTKVTQGSEFKGALLMEPEFFRMREIQIAEMDLEHGL